MAVNLRLRLARPGWGEVLGFSFTGQIEQCTPYLRCFFRRCFIQECLFLTVENLVSAGSLARCTQSVDILPLPLKCLQNTSFTKAARRERALCL